MRFRKRPPTWTQPLPRRDALKQLGALAAAAPLAAIGCSDDPPATASEPALGAGAGGAGPAAAAAGNASGNAGASPSAGVAGARASSAAGASGRGVAGSLAAGSGGSGASPAMAGSGGLAGASGAAAGSGGSAAGSGGSAAGTGPAAGSGGANAAGSGGSGAAMPMFDAPGTCMLTTTDIEGPFLIDDAEFPDDVSLVRSDLREGLPGVEFRLSFRLLDARMQCAPIAGAELYVWHCNSAGLYSGFDGQDPTRPYMGPANATPANDERFCRGVQKTDADGVATFITLYPGWYAGRPIHIHLMGRMPGATMRLITTQLYFPAAFTTEVHESEPPLMARAASMPAGSRNPPSGNPAMPKLMHTPGLVVGTMNVIVNRG